MNASVYQLTFNLIIPKKQISFRQIPTTTVYYSKCPAPTHLTTSQNKTYERWNPRLLLATEETSQVTPMPHRCRYAFPPYLNLTSAIANALFQGIVDSKTDKASEIEQRKANLPLPEQPPVASDLKSANENTVNVGSGRFSGNPPTDEHASALREPATADSSVRTSAEEWKKNVAPTKDIGRES